MLKKLLLAISFCGLLMICEAQWTEQATGFTSTSRGIRSLCAVDTNVVWATAYDGVTPTNEIQEFTRTIDGGNTWTPGAITGYTGWGLSMICAVNASKAWIPAWNPAGGGVILYTSDGGLTWTPQTTAVFAAPSGFPNVVHFWDENIGFCMGDPNDGYFEIYTTTNGGTTWTRVPQANIPANLASEWGTTGLYSVVGDAVWFTTGKGRVYKSIDRGHNWTVATTPNTTKQMQISMRSLLSGIAQVNESPYPAYQTQDGGATWTTLSNLGNFYANEFCYIPGTAASYISVGADQTNLFSGVSYSTDDGAIWDNFTGSDTAQFLAVDFVDANHGWVGTFNTDAVTGGMWYYHGTDFTVDPCADFVSYFTKSAATVDLNVSGQVDFTDVSTGMPSSWAWDFGDLGTSSSPSPSHTYTAVGAYPVTLAIGNGGGCSSSFTDTVTVINTAGISANSAAIGLEIWPNPATTQLNIQTVVTIDLVEIFNNNGDRVFASSSNNGHMNISLTSMADGLYFIRILTEKGISSGKFIIRK